MAVGHEVGEPDVIEDHGQDSIGFVGRRGASGQDLMLAEGHQRGIARGPEPTALGRCVLHPVVDGEVITTGARQLVLIGDKRHLAVACAWKTALAGKIAGNKEDFRQFRFRALETHG